MEVLIEQVIIWMMVRIHIIKAEVPTGKDASIVKNIYKICFLELFIYSATSIFHIHFY